MDLDVPDELADDEAWARAQAQTIDALEAFRPAWRTKLA